MPSEPDQTLEEPRGTAGDVSPEPTDRRAVALRAAARAKHEAAIARAEDGLRMMIKAGDRIEFRALARTAGVSVNFLYNNEELKERIEGLRDQQTQSSKPPPTRSPSTDNAVIRSLTAKLALERQEHARQVRILREQLATAHGELLRLRRSRLGSAGHA